VSPWIIVQARRGSSRLPDKVIAPLGAFTVLEYVLRRCRMSRRAAGVMLATTTAGRDAVVADLAAALGVPVFRGSEPDVLARYVGAAEMIGARDILRITADCPLIDPAAIDQAVESYEDGIDALFVEGYPNGLGDVDFATFAALREVLDITTPDETYYREHVTSYFAKNRDRFRVATVMAPQDVRRPEIRLSVDEQPDLDVVRRVAEHFSPRLDFTSREIIEFLDEHPEITAMNRHVRQRR
jgi:spore coat polysaccharide biosynthesis protein SpsF (cytidylyltransferase family)